MAVSLVSDNTIEGSGLSISADGMSITRRILIKGVEPTNAGNAYEVILNAERDALVPAIGDAYPTDAITPVNPSFSLVCTSKEVNPVADSKGIWEIVCTYEPADPAKQPAQEQRYPGDLLGAVPGDYIYAKPNTTASLVTLQTNKLFGEQTSASTWTSGAPVTIDLVKSGATPASDNKPNQSALVDVQKPTSVVTFQRHEIARPNSIGSHDFLGYMNDAAFSIYNKRTVLFTSITYEPVAINDNGEWTYITTYQFQAKTDGTDWTTDVIYTDPETNLPLASATDDFSTERTKKNFLTYQEDDFDGFKLIGP